MPYKRVGKKVYVKRKSGWKLMKTHPTIKAAIAHLTALRLNVRH